MLKVNELSFRFKSGNDDTLKALNFDIAKGEIFGFLGPSGAGKSTTQKILFKLITGFSGKVLFQDKQLQEWGREFYENIGVSFELPNHYLKLTAKENLQFFGSFYKKSISNINPLLEKVGLLEDADKYVSDFSKGMKMRLNFIRSLIHDPKMLFLDEPTSGLDPVNGNKIKKIIKELQAEGKTIFLSTHNMFDADQLCDRVALLHHGQIKALDTPANLKLQFGNKSVKVKTLNNEKSEHLFPLQNIGTNPDFLNLISSNQIATIHSQEATLEEVFIKITGQQLA